MRWRRAVLLLALAVRAPAEREPFRWRTDLAEARREAAAAGKPLLVVFRCVP